MTYPTLEAARTNLPAGFSIVSFWSKAAGAFRYVRVTRIPS